MAKFTAREIGKGCCTQYSYPDETELDFDADGVDQLRQTLETFFGGKIVDQRKITRGAWGGGFVVTFDNERWTRVRKTAV